MQFRFNSVTLSLSKRPNNSIPVLRQAQDDTLSIGDGPFFMSIVLLILCIHIIQHQNINRC